MVKQIVLMDYAAVILTLCLLIFILSGNYFDNKIRRLFLSSCILVLLLITADSIEYWAASLSYATSLRIWMSAVGYSLRPTIIFVVILLLLRQSNSRKISLLTIPLILNCILAFSALFTDIAFSYTPDNQFVRGPLGYFAFVTSGFYTIVLLVCTINLCKTINFSETLISIAVVCMFVMSTIMESFFKYDGVINTTGAVSLVFYYLYLNIQQFKKDPMTQALNRRCFYTDSEKNFEDITAVVSIDLNNLKYWNDEFGHAKGDEAICTIVKCIRKVLPRNCFLYRVGGDEFIVLCFRQKEAAVKQLLIDIKSEAARTPYSCAVGYALNNSDDDFNRLCAKADSAMYEDKARMKKAK